MSTESEDSLTTTVTAGEESKDFDLIPVTVADVAKYAKPGCSTCAGVGMVKVKRNALVHKRYTGPATVHVEACGCAFRRFVKKATYIVDHKTNRYYFIQPKS